jgi:hypothetical protein|tara:strand:- start:1795 stop:2310 length:516 start_codon:yes stop_codon:yes gene_type:complete
MKTEDKNNFYNDEDKNNFEKLNNFRKFNSKVKSNTQSKNHNIKYANSDKNYFNNIIKTEENFPYVKKKDAEKEIKYYNSSDFQKFEQLNHFSEYKNNTKQKLNRSTNSELNYSSNDYGEFNKIIQSKNREEKIINNQNKKVKIIDFNELKDNEKKLKNKLGIEKIKVVYFD